MSFQHINNQQKFNFKRIFNLHPTMSFFTMGSASLFILFLLKMLFFWSTTGNILTIILTLFFGLSAATSFCILMGMASHEERQNYFQTMSDAEANSMICNLQKTSLIYLLGVEQNIFYLNDYPRTDESNESKEVKRLGALILIAKWCENFYLKLEMIKKNRQLMDDDFYSMINDIQYRLKQKRQDITQDELQALELNWQQKTDQAILDEIKRNSNYHFKNLNALLNQTPSLSQDAINTVAQEGIFNATKKYLNNSL